MQSLNYGFGNLGNNGYPPMLQSFNPKANSGFR